MDSIGKIIKDLRAWEDKLGMTVPNEYADRLEALTKEPVAWMYRSSIRETLIARHKDENELGKGNEFWEPIGPLFAAPPAPAMPDAETIAKCFHTTYEQLAPEFGYTTRPESQTMWDMVPETNKALMIAVCEKVRAVIAATPEREGA